MFEKEKEEIKKEISSKSRIEHVGSTSIPGLGGKRIIDLMIVVKKNNLGKTKNELLSKGFVLMPHAGDKDRISFKKFYGLIMKKRVHVHLTYKGSKTERQTLKFRDNLIKNPKLRKDYEYLKKQAVIAAKGEGRVYRRYKENFIKKHSK